MSCTRSETFHPHPDVKGGIYTVRSRALQSSWATLADGPVRPQCAGRLWDEGPRLRSCPHARGPGSRGRRSAAVARAASLADDLEALTQQILPRALDIAMVQQSLSSEVKVALERHPDERSRCLVFGAGECQRPGGSFWCFERWSCGSRRTGDDGRAKPALAELGRPIDEQLRVEVQEGNHVRVEG
jgi:hypothetical protein